MSERFSRYGLLNHRSGFQRVMHLYPSYVKLWVRLNDISSLTDLSGNSNTLSASGSPVITEADYVELDRSAVTFDGSTDYYSITDAAQTGLDIGTDDAVILTVAKTSNDGSRRAMFSKSGNWYSEKTTSNLFRTRIFDGATNKYIDSSNTIHDGNWKVLQTSLDRDGNGQAYINGSADGSAVNISAVGAVPNATDFELGRYGANYWTGSIAEMMILAGAPLPAFVLSSSFASWVYNHALKWPLGLPHEG